METGTYMDLISVHYKDIKSLFKARLYNNGQCFDEDLFNDAFIKCAHKFGNDIIDYDLAVKYFWKAYSNTIKSAKSKDTLCEELDESKHDCIDDEDESHANYIYNIVMDAITAAYNEEDMLIYSLYKYHNWTEQELIDAGYNCKNLAVKIKNIHKFVKEYCKKHIKSL